MTRRQRRAFIRDARERARRAKKPAMAHGTPTPAPEPS
jgi:hypothetical protein